MIKKSKTPINGILLLDKPHGISSNTALQKVRRLLNAKKAGHAGSLDPIATGMLPIFFGEGTKLLRFLLEADKRYLVTAKLGVRTDSGDSEGNIISEFSGDKLNITETQIKQMLGHFVGVQQQIPPMFSAIKVNGEPLYKLARQGIEIPRTARTITVYDIVFQNFKNDKKNFKNDKKNFRNDECDENYENYENDKCDGHDEYTFTLEISVSKGTYIRTLIDDMGIFLGCGAHVISLRRLSVGSFHQAQMVSMDMLNDITSHVDTTLATGSEVNDTVSHWKNFLLPIETAVKGLPPLKLAANTHFYLTQGQAVVVPYAPTSGWVSLYTNDNHFVGVGEILDDGRVAPRRLICR